MQTFKGTVVAVKTLNTVKVAVEYIYRHPKYKKILKRTTKLLAHNELEGLKGGDLVEIIKSKPYSKLKHFKVVKKI
ncbi:30S ribosomal protein S17 [Candidatus Microgenomates bacterium]|nr:30S ribosomal protein S17 [Candidatus Microgenomates bacterium]